MVMFTVALAALVTALRTASRERVRTYGSVMVVVKLPQRWTAVVPTVVVPSRIATVAPACPFQLLSPKN